MRPSGLVLLNENVPWMGIAVNVSKFEDHLRVHLADLGGNDVRIDPVSPEVVNVIDVSAWRVKYVKYKSAIWLRLTFSVSSDPSKKACCFQLLKKAGHLEYTSKMARLGQPGMRSFKVVLRSQIPI